MGQMRRRSEMEKWRSLRSVKEERRKCRGKGETKW